MRVGRRRIGSHVLALACAALLVPGLALADCDVIPQPDASFRGAQGSLNRAFAGPRSLVTVSLDGGTCDGTSFPVSPASVAVTYVFTPPEGPASAVVVSGSSDFCSTTWTAGYEAQCESQLGGGIAECLDASGAVPWIASIASDELTAVFAPHGNGLANTGRTGPVKVAVSDTSAAPVCAVASQRCAETGGTLACIDEFYARDGTCDTAAQNRHPTFPGLTALPSPNDFAGICDTPDPSIPCGNSGANVEFTTDAAGNLIVPIDWQGILVPGTLPIPRLVRASSAVPAFSQASPAVGPAPVPGQTVGDPVSVPGLRFLESFSPKGLRLDPLFNPLFNPSVPELELFGSVDAEEGIIRILRRSPDLGTCEGGGRDGLPCAANGQCAAGTCSSATCRGGSNPGDDCTSDAQCLAGGECGSSLHNFLDRYTTYTGPGGSVAAAGPIVATSAEYDAEAQNPVAIDGLESTEDLFMFVRSESLEAADLNQDGDTDDETIVTLRDAESGDVSPIGAGGADGRASTRARFGSFEQPAVAVEDDVVAFLQAEAYEGGIDVNGDGDRLDTMLRVFRLGGAGAQPVSLATDPAADGMTVVDGASLALSDGLLFARLSEQDESTRSLRSPPSLPAFSSGTATRDGRFQYFNSDFSVDVHDTNGLIDGVLADRDVSGNGVYDEPGDVLLRWVTRASSTGQGTCADTSCTSEVTAASDDGRHWLFHSDASDLDPPFASPGRALYVHDRDPDGNGVFDELNLIETTVISRHVTGLAATISAAEFASMSADGRQVVFVSPDQLVFDDFNGIDDIYVVDRDADEDGVFDEFAQANATRVERLVTASVLYGVSATGRHVLYADGSPLQALVLDRDPDENGVFDEPGSTSTAMVSVDDDGTPTPFGISTGGSVPPFALGISRWNAHFVPSAEDGRYVRFSATTFDTGSLFLHDRDADEDGTFDEPGGISTTPLEVRGDYALQNVFAATDPRTGRIRYAVRTQSSLLPIAGGSPLLPESVADLIDLETGVVDRVVENPTAVIGDPFATAGLTTASPGPFGTDPNDPAADRNGDGDTLDVFLAVADTRAAEPISIQVLPAASEVAVAGGHALFLTPESSKGGAGADLSGDADQDDQVVHLYRNRGAVVNLALPGTQVALSPTWIGALADESGLGADRNGDGDLEDRVVHLDALASASGASWTNLAFAADDLQVGTRFVAFTVPEADQGPSSLNGDADIDDRVLHVWDTQTAALLPLVDGAGSPVPRPAVTEFVLGDELLAFRVREADQGTDLATAVPGGNGDGDLLDDVFHVIDLATGRMENTGQAAIPCPVAACDPRSPYRVQARQVSFLTLEAQQGGQDLDANGDGGTGLVLQHVNVAALTAGAGMADACDVLGESLGGVCTTTADACTTDADCGAGTCYVPPGGCLLDLGTACAPGGTDCGVNEFCAPTPGLPGAGTCQTIQGPCLTDAECTAPAFCSEGTTTNERIFAAIFDEGDGRQRFISTGRCSDGDGTCRVADDCNPGASCEEELTVVSAPDSDGDGLADPIDGCPEHPDPSQLDTDGDGIGDACDRSTCGNGIQEYEEECDGGASCSAACLYVGAGSACSDGEDNDGDGRVDAADAGCVDGADPDERDAALPCDDGIDNDGDGGVDVGGDPGCLTEQSANEAPECSDGIDNDGQIGTDHDGGPFGDVPDPNCTEAWQTQEAPGSPPGCGLGPELLGMLCAAALSRRRRRV